MPKVILIGVVWCSLFVIFTMQHCLLSVDEQTNHPLKGHVRVTWSIFYFYNRSHISGTV